MRIWYEHTRPVEEPEMNSLFELLKENWKKVCRSDTQIDIKCPRIGAKEIKYVIQGYPYCRFLRDVEMVEGLRQAEEEGYDAAVIGCVEDPGLGVARKILNIPVVGAGESSLMIGQAYGTIGLISLPIFGMPKGCTVSSQQRGAMKIETIKRPLNLSSEEIHNYLDENPSALVDDFVKVGRALINDGAKALIPAFTMLGIVLTSKDLTEIDGIPVIDSTITGVKIAEVLIDLKKAGFWKSMKTVSDNVIDTLRDVYYFGSKSH